MPDSNHKQSTRIEIADANPRLSIDESAPKRNSDDLSVDDTVYERSIDHQQDNNGEKDTSMHQKLLSYKDRIEQRLPTYAKIRKTLKGAIALELALIFTLASQTRQAIGRSVLLVPITIVFYFPVRPIG